MGFYHAECAQFLNQESNQGDCGCRKSDCDHGAGWDRNLQMKIGALTADVPEQLQATSLEISSSKPTGTFQSFFESYPNFEAVDFVGDGYSCIFVAVSVSASGSPAIATQLRILAVRSLCKNWGEIGGIVKSENADQSGEPIESLTQARCCRLLLGSRTTKPLWGNQCTLSQLPRIVKKNIAVQTLTNGKPYKHVFRFDQCEDTIFIGFVPEFHYFSLKVCNPGPARDIERGSDQGKPVPETPSPPPKTPGARAVALSTPLSKTILPSSKQLNPITASTKCLFGDSCRHDTEKPRHYPVCDQLFHAQCLPDNVVGCPCIFAADVSDPNGGFLMVRYLNFSLFFQFQRLSGITSFESEKRWSSINVTHSVPNANLEWSRK